MGHNGFKWSYQYGKIVIWNIEYTLRGFGGLNRSKLKSMTKDKITINMSNPFCHYISLKICLSDFISLALYRLWETTHIRALTVSKMKIKLCHRMTMKTSLERSWFAVYRYACEHSGWFRLLRNALWNLNLRHLGRLTEKQHNVIQTWEEPFWKALDLFYRDLSQTNSGCHWVGWKAGKNMISPN